MALLPLLANYKKLELPLLKREKSQKCAIECSIIGTMPTELWNGAMPVHRFGNGLNCPIG